MHILLVDDDAEIRSGFTVALRRRGHTVVSAATAREALLLAERTKPMVGVIDVMLPDRDGFYICRTIAERWGFPTVMLTARDDDANVIVGLDSGADDYVVKPVSTMVLEARLRAVVRRHARGVDLLEHETVTVGDLVIDRSAQEARFEDKTLPLSRTEFRLLQEMAEQTGIALSRDRLIDTVWSENSPETARVVDTTVQRLRAKLESAGIRTPELETLRGIGYRLR